jgi:hypothetical protein
MKYFTKPTKFFTICYIHQSTERLTQEFTIKEIAALFKLMMTT